MALDLVVEGATGVLGAIARAAGWLIRELVVELVFELLLQGTGHLI